MKYNVPKYQICYTLWLSVKHKIHLLTTRHIITLFFFFEISWIVTVTRTIEKLKGGAPEGAVNPLLHKAQNHNQYHCP